MILAGLFDSLGGETISGDDYVWNYGDVGEFNNETDRLVFSATRMPVMRNVTE